MNELIMVCCPNRIAYCCQECNAVCCWYCDRRLRDPDAAEVKTIANRFCDEARCVAAEAIAHGLPTERLAKYRARRKEAHASCKLSTGTGPRWTYCPGCDHRILPGQDVVGVKGKEEDGSDWLWHRAHLQWKEMRDGIKITPDPEVPGRANIEIAIRQTTAEERAAYMAAREAARPAVEDRMRQNVDLADRIGEAQDLLDKLEERAHAVGALLAGPAQNEGVIDKDRVWHDLENPDGSPCTSFEEELASIERIVAKLEAT